MAIGQDISRLTHYSTDPSVSASLGLSLQGSFAELVGHEGRLY